MALCIVTLCALFGAEPVQNMLPSADRRYGNHENMDRALDFIRHQVSPMDVIYLNNSTELQAQYYFCDRKAITLDRSVAGFESFRCHGLRVISSFPNDDAVRIETFPTKWLEMAHAYGLKPGTKVWIFSGGWSRGFAEELKSRYPEFAGIQVQSFGRCLQIFSLAVPEATSAASPPARMTRRVS